jgi:hypothetical protein
LTPDAKTSGRPRFWAVNVPSQAFFTSSLSSSSVSEPEIPRLYSYVSRLCTWSDTCCGLLESTT